MAQNTNPSSTFARVTGSRQNVPVTITADRVYCQASLLACHGMTRPAHLAPTDSESEDSEVPRQYESRSRSPSRVGMVCAELSVVSVPGRGLLISVTESSFVQARWQVASGKCGWRLKLKLDGWVGGHLPQKRHRSHSRDQGGFKPKLAHGGLRFSCWLIRHPLIKLGPAYQLETLRSTQGFAQINQPRVTRAT